MKRKLTRPSVTVRKAGTAGETLVEFLFPNGKGGLISFHTSSTGEPVVDIYRTDAGIKVLALEGNSAGTSTALVTGDFR